MRKLFFAAAAAATLFTAAGAGADSFTHTVSLSAEVPLVCSFGVGAPTHTAAFTNVSAAASSLAVAVGTAGVTEQTASLTFANSFCNGNNTSVRLQRQGLKVVPGAQTAPGFKSQINYEVNVRWGTADVVTLPTDPDVVDHQNEIGAMNGDFVLEIHVPASSDLFVADTYSDSLILTVQPTT